MRLVIAPNAFKGSLSAVEAAEAIAEGVRVAASDADVVLVPIADGGDGTVDALVAATGGEHRTLRLRGPLGDPVDADYGRIDGGDRNGEGGRTGPGATGETRPADHDHLRRR